MLLCLIIAFQVYLAKVTITRKKYHHTYRRCALWCDIRSRRNAHVQRSAWQTKYTIESTVQFHLNFIRRQRTNERSAEVGGNRISFQSFGRRQTKQMYISLSPAFTFSAIHFTSCNDALFNWTHNNLVEWKMNGVIYEVCWFRFYCSYNFNWIIWIDAKK